MIEAKGLSMSYGDVHALRDATFRAEPGQVVGLLGPNGAGKTTTMRILTTFVQPTGGSAQVAGYDVVAEPLEVRRRMGYLPEALPLYMSMEVRDCLQFVGRARGLRGARLAERIRFVVDKCGLDRMYHTPCRHLSKGYRQRTALAQALLHDPEVIVLDEPTTGLDPHQILEIRALVRELAHSKTVILSTHIMQEAEALADRLLVMSMGAIVGRGTADELRRLAGVPAVVAARFAGVDDDGERRLGALFAPYLHSCRRDPATGEVVVEIEEHDPGLTTRLGDLAHVERWSVHQLAHTKGSLEQVFLNLTGVRHNTAPAQESAA